jgi:hypothetical protein
MVLSHEPLLPERHLHTFGSKRNLESLTGRDDLDEDTPLIAHRREAAAAPQVAPADAAA